MTLDLFWTTNSEWYEDAINSSGKHYDRLRDSAPPEAKKSYERYLKQIEHAAAIKRENGVQLI